MLTYKNNNPYIEGTSLYDLVKVCETPFYAYSQKKIVDQVNKTKQILGKNIRLKVTSKGIKTVEKNGGIDNYILGLKNSLLNDQTRKIKKILTAKKSS